MVGLRIVFQKVSKKRKIDECAEIMPFRGKHAGRVWLMSGLMIEYRVARNGVLVEGRQLLLWGVLMLPYRGKHAGVFDTQACLMDCWLF